MAAARGSDEPETPLDGPLARVVEALGAGGARFAAELVAATGLGAAQVEKALQDGAARGLITADGFWALRSLFEERRASAGSGAALPRQRSRRLRRAAASPRREPGEGRWSLVPPPFAVLTSPTSWPTPLAEQLLARWGVVSRDLLGGETLGLPWREIQWALRRLEARGVARGGRFVTGISGEQYALPEAMKLLVEVAKLPRDGEVLRVNTADPLNLTGHLPGAARVPIAPNRCLAICDGRFLAS